MFNPITHIQGVRTLTPKDLGLDFQANSIDSGTSLDDIDDDIDFNAESFNTINEMQIIELPQSNFNVRTLTQDKIDEMKRNRLPNTEWIPRL